MAPTLTPILNRSHRIEPVRVYVAGIEDHEWACDVCGQKLYRIKGGWRHDPASLPERPATWPRGAA